MPPATPASTVLLFAACAAASAAEYSPRVVAPHVADTYSLTTFAQHPRWRHLHGDAKTWEVLRYLTDRHTGLFPLGQPVYEGRDLPDEFRTVRDPVKLVNVYGYGFCGILGPVMAGIAEDMGLGRSRTLLIPGWHHVAAETYYDDKWHYLDLDVRAAFRRPDGALASMADAQRDASLWKGPQGPLFFPLDPPQQVQKVYQKTPVRHQYQFHSGGHTMDLLLRQGETFTRWWRPQGGRWLHNERYHNDPFFQALFERAPRGPKCKHAGWTVHSHGNGRIVYQPNLTSQSTDFEDGVYESDNVRPQAGGLTLTNPGKGHVVFVVRSPYVIVPLVGKQESSEDDREASVVELDAAGASLSVSLDNGHSWKAVTLPGGGRSIVDLTQNVSGTYGYLLKLSLNGQPGAAVVRTCKITTWVQVAPASLPALQKGTNRMEYRSGDHHGLRTRVMEVRTNGSDRADFLKYCHEPPKDLDPARKTARAKGAFVVAVSAPPRTRIAWLSAGGSFSAHQGAAAKMTRNSIAYAADEPKDFQEVYRAAVPEDQDHWHYQVDREVKLSKPARVVYLRYVGDPGVNNLRIYAHCLDDRPRAASAVVITHAWKEKGAARTKKVTMSRPGTYDVVAEAEPENESVELSVLSK